MGSRRSGRPPAGLTALNPTVRVPSEAIRRADSPGAGRPGRPDRGDRPARKVHADQRRTDTHHQVVPGGTVTERWVPVDAGRALRARRPGHLPVQRGDERGARRRSPGWTRSRSPARRSGTTGLPHTRVLAACALLGVDEVYAVGGAQAVAMLAYGGTDAGGANCAAGRHDHRAGQHLRHRRQAAAARRGRHRRRGRADRDRDPRRRHRRPGARRRRPDQPGRARPARRQRAGHPSPQPWPTRSTASWPTRCRPPSTASGSPRRWRASSPRPCWSTTSTRGCGWSTRTRPSTWRSRPRRPRGGAAGPQRRRDLRRRLLAGVASATTAPAPTTCCPPAAAPGTPRVCRCRPSCAAPRRRLRRGGAARGGRARRHPGRAEDLPAHGEAVRRAVHRRGPSQTA